MRDPKRIDQVLGDIKKIWKKYPDLRLGQFILNAVPEPPLYYVEDEELIKAIKYVYEGEEK